MGPEQEATTDARREVTVDAATGFSPLDIRQAAGSGRLWRLLRPLVFRAQMNGHGGLEVIVPAGAVTDFASIPRLLWRIFPQLGPYNKAAVAHDYLYWLGISRFLADSLFREMMARSGVSAWQRVPMYYAVRCFGWWSWRKHRRKRRKRKAKR